MFSFFNRKPKGESLLDEITELVELLEDQTLTIQDIVIKFIEGKDLTMEDIDKANKKLIKKYGKSKLKAYRFPAVPNCEYENHAHSNCLCLYVYYRPF